MNEPEKELVEVTQRLLDSIANADWETYTELCDPTLTAFEPEALGRLVHGMPFHKFYFDLGPSDGSRNTTICDPHVRIMGDVAVIAYTRLVQIRPAHEEPKSATFQETRVWQRVDSKWQHVHFHRS
ncbi:MAG: DUF4440 domain-containing protein [Planctomycetales bacterium]|nr:DUF4440 domain-containing protein [Planctomycetales bacterium]